MQGSKVFFAGVVCVTYTNIQRIRAKVRRLKHAVGPMIQGTNDENKPLQGLIKTHNADLVWFVRGLLRIGGALFGRPPLPWLFGQVGSADQCPSAPQELQWVTFFNSSGGSFLRAGLEEVYFLPKVTPESLRAVTVKISAMDSRSGASSCSSSSSGGSSSCSNSSSCSSSMASKNSPSSSALASGGGYNRRRRARRAASFACHKLL